MHNPDRTAAGRALRRLTPLILIFGASLAQAGEDWPQFRGPQGDGTSTATELPLFWSETNHIAWKTAVPGLGRSSPVVQGEHIWVTTALTKGERRAQIGPDEMWQADHLTLEAVCLNRADGRIVWESPLLEVDQPGPVHRFNSWATPTPAVSAGRLYCDFGTYGTVAVEANSGRVLWRQTLPLEHQVGPGSSVAVWQNRLLLIRDGCDVQFVTALDTDNGRTAWKTDRPPIETPTTDLRKAFSTPLLIQHKGRTQMIAAGAHWIVSYDPATGREFWRIRHGRGFSFGSCPVYGNGLVYFGTGSFKAQLWAVRPDGEGDVTATHVAWTNLQHVPIISSPVFGGKEVYWISDDGTACCADAVTGQLAWQEKLGRPHHASPLFAGGRVYCFGLDGRTTVVKAGRQFQRLAENKLEGPLVATPALLRGTIILRTDHYLYCIVDVPGADAQADRTANTQAK